MSFNLKSKASAPGTDARYKYSPDFPDRVLKMVEESRFGLSVEQIAVNLGFPHSTLYNWKAREPDFKHAMEFAATQRLAKMKEQWDLWHQYHDEQGERTTFHDRTHMQHMQLAGYGRNISVIRGITNELDAAQKVQDAMAGNEMSFEAGLTMSNVLRNKVEIRKTLELQAQIDDMQEKLEMILAGKTIPAIDAKKTQLLNVDSKDEEYVAA